jgi:hypothetical protein
MLMCITLIMSGLSHFRTALFQDYMFRLPYPNFERATDDEFDPEQTSNSVYLAAFEPYLNRPHNFLADCSMWYISIPLFITWFGFLTMALIKKDRRYVQLRQKQIVRINELRAELLRVLGDKKLVDAFGDYFLASKVKPEYLLKMDNPYELHRILHLPLGPAIEIVERFKDYRAANPIPPGSSSLESRLSYR